MHYLTICLQNTGLIDYRSNTRIITQNVLCLFVGCHETTIEIRDLTTISFSAEQYITKEKPFNNNSTAGTPESNIQQVLQIYRAVIIPVGLLISCILAFVIIREIRLHYFASNETNQNNGRIKMFSKIISRADSI